MLNQLRNLLGAPARDSERGASAVEYGLLIAGIAAVIVTVVMALGPAIQSKFQTTCDAVSGSTCGKKATTGDTGS